MSSPEKEYILGTGNDELIRLGIQHRVWADASVAAWKKAGIGPGTKVMDLGCGPGHATFDLAQLVTEEGLVLALDESKSFIDYLNAQSSARGLPQLKAKTGDALNLTAAFDENEIFDAIYCRWVLCWLPNPEKALIGMLKMLKPGGRLVIHDYFNWKSMTAGPRSEAIEKMVIAAVSSFEEKQGNVDIAAHLPSLLKSAGFTIQHFDIHQRVARGGGLDSTLAWPLTWWRAYGPKLVKMGKLSSAVYEQAAQDLTAIEKDPDRFFFCPPLFEFIAKKQ